MKKRVRLKDIASALNLSITTVSRALNDKSDISDETKQKVLQVAEILDYRPNYFAKFLTEDHNNILGVIVPKINHSYFSKIIEGAFSEAHKRGYFIIIGESLDDPKEEEHILNQFLDLKVQGILVAPVYQSLFTKPDIISKYKNERIVLIDRSSLDNVLPEITNNHLEGALTAMRHLDNEGYTTIAHIKGLVGDDIASAIYQGYQQFISQNNKEEITFTCDEVTPHQGYQATQQFMSLKNKPDAIFAISDEAAQGVYRYCYEHDIKIPDQLGVIGYSNASFSRYLTPSLSTIEQHSYEMGKYATSLLSSDEELIPEMKRVFQSALIKRESTKRTSK